MTWRLAKSLEVLRKQVNKAAPNRSKASDGTIGDEKHASRSSDHNPWVKDGKTGVVTALDITHDPAHGIHSEALAEALRASKDARIKYVLSNRKIFAGAGGQSSWKWRKYGGVNPHNKHVHLSVKSSKSIYDSDKPWDLDLPIAPALSLGSVIGARTQTAADPQSAPTPNVEPVPTPPDGDPEVYLVQKRLKQIGYNPGGLDGRWGGITAGAIAGFNNDRGRRVQPKIDDAFKAELAKAEAEGFTRPIAEERANPTSEKLAEKAPEIVPAKRNRLTAILAFFGSIGTGIATFFKDALEWLGPVKEFASDIPSTVWLGVAAGVAALIWWNARDGVNRITESVQTGDRP